jgi:hypothetical protein
MDGTYLFFPERGVGLVPKRGCLLTLAYYTFPRRYEFGERRWNDILTTENRRTRRKICPSATLATTNPTWIDPGANPGLHGEKPATNDLSHGTALVRTLHDCKASNAVTTAQEIIQHTTVTITGMTRHDANVTYMIILFLRSPENNDENHEHISV